ncbi:MAG TPA: hypothetical protein VFH63_00170 [candidate division Zixibacteria bacterium]|nr:hypothetical protein [candidate division Zixibacteria bacterium]
MTDGAGAANLERADTFFDEYVRPELDPVIERGGYDAPPWEPDRVDYEPPTVRQLDLRDAGISTVIWATGYRFDFGWIPTLELDATGYPLHRRGVTAVPGLHLLGLPWLYRRSSSLLAGVGPDAEYLAQQLTG